MAAPGRGRQARSCRYRAASSLRLHFLPVRLHCLSQRTGDRRGTAVPDSHVGQRAPDENLAITRHLDLNRERRSFPGADRPDCQIDPVSETRRGNVSALALDNDEVVSACPQGLVAAALPVKPGHERVLEVLVRPGRVHHSLSIAVPWRNPDLQDSGCHEVILPHRDTRSTAAGQPPAPRPGHPRRGALRRRHPPLPRPASTKPVSEWTRGSRAQGKFQFCVVNLADARRDPEWDPSSATVERARVRQSRRRVQPRAHTLSTELHHEVLHSAIFL